jgi:hypothetical protein
MADLQNEQILHCISPRAIPTLLLLARDIGITCYASGSGGRNYMLVSSIVFKDLSIEMPLTLLWPSRDISHGCGQSHALNVIGLTLQSQVDPYLESLQQKHEEYKHKIIPLLQERKQRINDSGSIQKILSDVFKLKEEQRKIRQLIKITNKVKNAIEMSPCFIDYAVNFGMANTELQWCENLLKNDHFNMPVLMTPMITSKGSTRI